MAPGKKGAARGKSAKQPLKARPGKRLVFRTQQHDGPRKLVERPPHRRVFVDRGPQWLVLEPHRLGMAAAALFSVLAMLGYNIAGWLGVPVPVSQMLIGAVATFVISYAAVGLFVWYVLLVAEREFGAPVERGKKSLSLLGMGDMVPGKSGAGAQPAVTEPEDAEGPPSDAKMESQLEESE